MFSVINHVVCCGKSRGLYVAVVLPVAVALVPLAYASPPDSMWIAGIYDAADYDDVVSMTINTQMDQLAQSAPAALRAAVNSVLAINVPNRAVSGCFRIPSSLASRRLTSRPRLRLSRSLFEGSV